MKCPVCQAKLLPVDGEMFCLQCGQTLRNGVPVSDGDNLKLEETSDPMLQRAIRDAGNYETQFVATPAVDAVKPVKGKTEPIEQPAPTEMAEAPQRRRSFISLHAVVMAPRALTPSGMLMTDMADQSGEITTGAPGERREFVRVRAGRTRSSVRGWLAGVAVVVIFAAVNVGIGSYYSDRVYPGVKVGNVNVGGWTFQELSARLPDILSQPSMTANVQGRSYPLDVSGAATVSAEAVARSAKDLGRQSPLPVAGVLQAVLAGPIKPSYTLTDEASDQLAARLAAKVDRTASDAAILTAGTNVIVLAEKPGARLDRTAAAAAIRAAYGAASSVSLSLVKVPANVAAPSFDNDKAAAEAVIGQNLQLIVRKAHYTPSAAQLASWVIFLGPGKGIAIDPNGPAAFVAAIPGTFDRAAAVTSLTQAATAHLPAVLTASTKRVTVGPKAADAAVAAPIMTYKYCVQSTLTDVSSLKTAAAEALGTGNGWAMGGRLKFEAVESDCNFDLQIVDPATLAKLDSACGDQSTCRIHNELAINAMNWSTPPAWWKSDLSSYRQELINHLVGQWLGFDHGSCKSQAAVTPLNQPIVTIAGCSPNWHPVPVELQDTKVLAGF